MYYNHSRRRIPNVHAALQHKDCHAKQVRKARQGARAAPAHGFLGLLFNRIKSVSYHRFEGAPSSAARGREERPRKSRLLAKNCSRIAALRDGELGRGCGRRAPCEGWHDRSAGFGAISLRSFHGSLLPAEHPREPRGHARLRGRFPSETMAPREFERDGEVVERPRAIMRTFYVIDTEGSVERDPMLAGVARRSVRDTQPCPPPWSPTACPCTVGAP
jgi:hypothetical protein